MILASKLKYKNRKPQVYTKIVKRKAPRSRVGVNGLYLKMYIGNTLYSIILPILRIITVKGNAVNRCHSRFPWPQRWPCWHDAHDADHDANSLKSDFRDNRLQRWKIWTNSLKMTDPLYKRHRTGFSFWKLVKTNCPNFPLPRDFPRNLSGMNYLNTKFARKRGNR